MDVAIVTGAASGMGLAVARKLVGLGFRVYGLGGNYQDTPFNHRYFHPTPCNLQDAADIKAKIDDILDEEGEVLVLVNNAKVYANTEFAVLDLPEMERVIRINLMAPLQLTRMVLPGLVKLHGHVINIAASSVDTARGGVTGAICSGGLRWMSEALFHELREYGVRVSTVFPQSNRVRLDDPTRPPRENPQSFIDPEAVADAVATLVAHKDGNVITELVVRPQRLKECPVPPPLHLPYPPPSPDSPQPVTLLDDPADKSRRERQRAQQRRERDRERQEQARRDASSDPTDRKSPAGPVANEQAKGTSASDLGEHVPSPPARDDSLLIVDERRSSRGGRDESRRSERGERGERGDRSRRRRGRRGGRGRRLEREGDPRDEHETRDDADETPRDEKPRQQREPETARGRDRDEAEKPRDDDRGGRRGKSRRGGQDKRPRDDKRDDSREKADAKADAPVKGTPPPPVETAGSTTPDAGRKGKRRRKMGPPAAVPSAWRKEEGSSAPAPKPAEAMAGGPAAAKKGAEEAAGDKPVAKKAAKKVARKRVAKKATAKKGAEEAAADQPVAKKAVKKAAKKAAKKASAKKAAKKTVRKAAKKAAASDD